ncbi:MAG: DUF481 domain-containing protein [Saprospiraceae bacterium]
MTKTILSITLFLFAQIIFAQDSIQWKIDYDFEASALHLNPGITSEEILIDPVIYRKRRANNIFRPRREFVSDNPNFHTASYIGVKLRTSFKNKYHFQSNLYFEHRGASYGSNDRDNIVWFPHFTFSSIDTFRVLKKKIIIETQAGNFVQAQINNGLKVYNQDYQGINIKISHQNLFFEYHQVGDLANQIGLNLEEYIHLSLGFENEKIRLIYSQNLNWTGNSFAFEDYWDSDISLNYFLKKNNELYFQYGHRNNGAFDLAKNGAFVLGAKFSLIDTDQINWKINPSLRYYSANYNEGHYNPNFTYRDPTKGLYSNTAGRFLYPLRNYYYDFDRWGVHTEYQDENIFSIALKTEFDLKIWNKFHIKTNLETLSIHREEEFYTNYFYVIDFYYNIRKGLQLGFIMANKTYNLDASFPTFYTMKKPMFGVHLKLDSIK